MRSGMILSLVMLLSACFHQPIRVNYFKPNGFIVEDTCRLADEYLQSFEGDGFPIYYLGPAKDTISIGRRYWQRRHQRFREAPQRAIFNYSAVELSIEVDTLSDVCQPLEYLDEERLIDRYCDSNRYYHASLITIRNRSDTAIYLGVTFSVYQLHREILNSRGEWIKVSEKLSKELFCATGQPDIYLMPGEVMISKVAHMGGKHRVKCRLALGHRDATRQVYSNTFMESINDSLMKAIEKEGMNSTTGILNGSLYVKLI